VRSRKERRQNFFKELLPEGRCSPASPSRLALPGRMSSGYCAPTLWRQDLPGRGPGQDRGIAAQLAAHPDAEIFTSLPRSGTVRAARLLAEIGDARGRFPTRESLPCLAGVAPSTRQSGKVKAVTFRWGADKQLRDALCDFAGDSRSASPWAASLYDEAIARGCDHPHAVRILARAWAHVIWRCWQDHAFYDPAAHNGLQTILKQRQPIAA
jgi:hypothetical protein